MKLLSLSQSTIFGLVDFLNGMPGSASLDFNLNGAFTRLLVGWHSVTNDQLQVTHSNFNYSIHETDLLNLPAKSDQVAHMRLPLTPFASEAVIYPDYSPGSYQVRSFGRKNRLMSEHTLNSTRSTLAGNYLQFTRLDGMLPSRIVTAIENVSSLTKILFLNVHLELFM